MIKYNSFSLLIIKYKKYIIKKIFNKAYNLKTKDLKLFKVIIIKGFYINIVSEA